MRRDETVYLRHILDAIDLIEDYTEGMSENEFFSNSMAHDAVIRQIKIIGEAARNISDEFREQYKEVPWGKMIGVRNKFIHEYFNINYAIVWDTVKEDLPVLKETIKNILT